MVHDKIDTVVALDGAVVTFAIQAPKASHVDCRFHFLTSIAGGRQVLREEERFRGREGGRSSQALESRDDDAGVVGHV